MNNSFVKSIIDSNISVFEMINEDYINKIYKNAPYHLIKNQLRLSKNIIEILYFFLFKKKQKINLKNKKNVFISVTNNNTTTFSNLISKFNLKGEILSYGNYTDESKPLIIIDLFNSIFGFLIHIFIFFSMPLIFKERQKRAFLYSNEISKSIICAITIRFIKLGNIKRLFISNDHNYFTRLLIKKSKKNTIKTFFVTHGQPSEAYPKPITDNILVDNYISKTFFVENHNINKKNIQVIEYPKLYGYSFKKKIYDFGVCSTPSMTMSDIIFILSFLSKNYKIIYRPHPSMIGSISKIYDLNIASSNPKKEIIKTFYEKSEKIITGNSGVLFESLYLKKTTFIWTENVINKFGEIDNKDRYGVLKKKYCIELNKANIDVALSNNYKLSSLKYKYLFPIGVNNKFEKKNRLILI